MKRLLVITSLIAAMAWPAAAAEPVVFYPGTLALPLIGAASVSDDCDLLPPTDLGFADDVCLRVPPAEIQSVLDAYYAAILGKGWVRRNDMLGAAWFRDPHATAELCGPLAISTRADGQIVLWMYGGRGCPNRYRDQMRSRRGG